MALSGFTIGNTAPATGAPPDTSTPPVASAPISSGALSGFSIGATPVSQMPVATPVPTIPNGQQIEDEKSQQLIASTKAYDTSKLFQNSLSFLKGTPNPKVPASALNLFGTKKQDQTPLIGTVIASPFSASDMANQGKSLTDQATALQTEGKNIDTSSKAKVDAYNAKVDQYKKDMDTYNANVSQFNAAQKASDVLSKPVIPVGQTIKFPLIKTPVTVPSGGEIGSAYSLMKGLIELPEKATRSLTELAGISKANSDTRGYGATPSYAEVAGKTTGDIMDELIASGYDAKAARPAAVILGAASVAGSFANDALVYLDPLAGEGGVLKSTVLEDALTKQVVSTHIPETVRYFNPNEVKDIWQTGKLLTDAEKQDVITVINNGGAESAAKIKEAIKNGISIKVPAQDITTLEERPYWSKIKEFFGKEPASPELIKKTVNIPVQTVRGYLTDGVDTNTTAVHPVLKDEINDHIQTHGIDATTQSLSEKFGIPLDAATKIVTDATSARTASELENAHKEVLQAVSPETQRTALKGVKISEEAPAEAKPVVVKESTAQGRKQAQIKPVETNEGEVRKSALFQRVKDSLGDQYKGLEGPEYSQANMEKQAEKATSFLLTYPERAERIALGKELPPEGHLANSITTAYVQKNLAEGNTAKAVEAMTAQSLRSTRYGQEIAALKGATTDIHSPEFWIKKALDAKLEKYVKSDVVYKVTARVAKATGGAAPAKPATIIDEGTKELKKAMTKDQMKIAQAQKLLDNILCK